MFIKWLVKLHDIVCVDALLSCTLITFELISHLCLHVLYFLYTCTCTSVTPCQTIKTNLIILSKGGPTWRKFLFTFNILLLFRKWAKI